MIRLAPLILCLPLSGATLLPGTGDPEVRPFVGGLPLARPDQAGLFAAHVTGTVCLRYVPDGSCLTTFAPMDDDGAAGPGTDVPPTVTPLPAPVLFLAAGLAGLFALRRAGRAGR